MTHFYDMHCHLGFAPDAVAAAAEGAGAGISALSCTVTPAEYETLAPPLADAPGVTVALGAHPWWVADGRIGRSEIERFCELTCEAPFIGEIGLDFAGARNTEESRRLQVEALQRILAALGDSGDGAKASDRRGTYGAASDGAHAALNGAAGTSANAAPRPCAADAREAAPASNAAPASEVMDAAQPSKLISLHAVDAAGAVLDLLKSSGTLARHRVVFHWFSGTSDELNRAIAAGCYFSVGFRMLASRRGREYARQIPLDRLLLETDAPSREGQPLPANEWRALLNNALSGIAQLRGLAPEALAEQVGETSRTLLKQ